MLGGLEPALPRDPSSAESAAQCVFDLSSGGNTCRPVRGGIEAAGQLVGALVRWEEVPVVDEMVGEPE